MVTTPRRSAADDAPAAARRAGAAAATLEPGGDRPEMGILYALFFAQFFIVVGLVGLLLLAPGLMSDLTLWAMAGIEDGSLWWQLAALNAILLAIVVGPRLYLRWRSEERGQRWADERSRARAMKKEEEAGAAAREAEADWST